MSVLSGILGAVDGIHTIRNWNVNDSASPNVLSASNTKGAVARTPGNVDWSGSYASYGHTPVKMPGDEFDFLGSIDGSDDNGVGGDAIVDSTEIVIDIAGGKPIEHTVEFSAKGTLALNRDSSEVEDIVVPTFPPSIGCKLQLGTMITSPVWSELIDVTVMRLRFSRNNPTYASSSTAGVVRRVRGNLDCSLSVDCLTDNFSSLPAKNSFKGLRVFIDATQYWELLWSMVENLTNLKCEIEGAAPVGGTLNFGFTGYALINGTTPTQGSIKKPGGSTYWPS